jgi:hypothetical protein
LAYLIIGLICGVICAFVAAHKGRNAVGWFFFGFFFGLVAVIVSLVVSNLKHERARYAKAAAERRRLREELKMEKIQRQQSLGHTNRRLDMHDRALGVDTSQASPPPELPGRSPVRSLGQPGSPPPPQWHYAGADGEQVGPVTFAELTSEYRGGRLRDDSLVWKPGWKEWHRIGEVDGLKDALRP